MIFVRSFGYCFLPRDAFPTGEVEVAAQNGVELERCIPVFMYASLS